MKLLESVGRIVAISRKEIRQLRRDRLTFGMVVAIPIVQLVLFGYAINEDVRHLRAAAVDYANTQNSRLLLADAHASQVIDLVRKASSAEELEEWLRRGEIRVGIVIPADYERRLEDRKRHGRSARPLAQILVDASDPATYGSVAGLLNLPPPERPGIQPPRWRYGSAISGVSNPPPTFEARPFYNPERRSAVHIVPGLVGVILTMTMVLFTSVAIVRERERGSLELLITTPMKPVELMVGKILPYVLIGLIQVGLVLGVGALIFRVPLRATPQDTIVAALVFITASLTLGLLISTIAKTQFQAFQLTFFSFLPQMLLSGFMFPFDAMPRPAQWIAELMPLTHFLRVIRGILLRGARVVEMRHEIWPLAVFALVMLTLAAGRFRKRLD
ncbi:MAG: ABC transporter permease [Thermoanaerobaculia bacterium]|nr:ABC transporter permease [Thermoanaerobaculia bacterium]